MWGSFKYRIHFFILYLFFVRIKAHLLGTKNLFTFLENEIIFVVCLVSNDTLREIKMISISVQSVKSSNHGTWSCCISAYFTDHRKLFALSILNKIHLWHWCTEEIQINFCWKTTSKSGKTLSIFIVISYFFWQNCLNSSASETICVHWPHIAFFFFGLWI